MASGFEITLTENRSDVHRKIDTLENGWRVTLSRPKRSLPQNALMWALLDDVSTSVIWYGHRLTKEEWKDLFTSALRRSKSVPNLDGDGFVSLGLHTSDMDDAEMAELIELIQAFGAQNNVRWKAPRWVNEMAMKQRTAKPKASAS